MGVVQIIDSKLKLGLHKIKSGKILLQQEGLVIFSIFHTEKRRNDKTKQIKRWKKERKERMKR